MSSTETIKELESQLECALCKDTFREPKTLGCLHSYCLECLEIYASRNHSIHELKCPICRTPFQVEQKQQLANLPTDSFLLHTFKTYNSLNNSISQQKKKQKLSCEVEGNEATAYCLDCQEYFCDACTKAHKTMKMSKNHQVILIEEIKDENQIKSITNSNPQLYCQIHQQEEMKLFCDDCKLSICSLCVPKHSSHKFSEIFSMDSDEKQSLFDRINQVKPREKELREGINKCEETIKQLEINSTTTQIEINEFFNKIRIKLDEKEQELLNKLDEMEKFKKKELGLQIEELEFGIENILGSCQMIENSLSLSNNNKSDMRLLSMKKLYHSRLNYLSNNIWKIEPCHHPFIEFISRMNEVQSIYSHISNIGRIDSNEISTENCFILGNENQRIIKGEEYIFEIISCSKEGNFMRNGGNGNKFEIKIKRELNKNGENDGCEIVDLNNGKYEVKLKLKDEGKYLISVEYDGMNLPASSFQIQVFSIQPRNYNEINDPKLIFGSKGRGKGQFKAPYGVIMDSVGDILVCDKNNHRIQIFNSEGNFISKFGKNGNGNGQFQYPVGLAINSGGNIIVSDQKNHRIQIFDSDGDFILMFGTCGNRPGQFNGPSGICVDKNDNIYVCDADNHRIQEFDSEGKIILMFGLEGDGNGQFVRPAGVTINSKGNIIVADSENDKIQIFDSKGTFISKFGSYGDGDGQFHGPHGVCVDKSDNIFICDYHNNRIQIFNPEGVYITQFYVDHPINIEFDPKGQNIIVCTMENQIFIF